MKIRKLYMALCCMIMIAQTVKAQQNMCVVGNDGKANVFNVSSVDYATFNADEKWFTISNDGIERTDTTLITADCTVALSSESNLKTLSVNSKVILAVSKGGKDFDAWPINSRILSRWSDHPFYVPLLDAALHKEEERWMQGKRMNLLRYELREMEGEECGHITQFMTDIAGMADQAGASTVKEVLLVFNRYNADHGFRYQQPIDMLYAKLDGLARQQVHIERVNDIHGNGKVNIGN
jgi:hypothetical protein